MGTSILRTCLAAALLLACSAATAEAAGPSKCNGFPNGQLDGDEECETGACCTTRCELASPDTVCGQAGTDPVCDPTEVCGERAPVAHAGCPNLNEPPDGTPCSDDLFCTAGDSCQDGECVGGTAPACDDDNHCTTDICSEQMNQCQHQNIANGEPCDDGDACTDFGSCQGGQCIGDQVVVCNDNNDCTDDACHSVTGCVFTNNDNPCDDGLFCTENDSCEVGQCGGIDRNCGDGNVCTTDICNESADQCDNLANTVLCDDLLFCTENDQCSGGACSGTAIDCGDGNPCTDDNCNDTSDACENPNNAAPCEDGSFCTAGDSCTGGACVSGGARGCGDNNDCTADSCDEDGNECDNTPTTAGCDDGLFCTVGDACSDGLCTGTLRDCDDGQVCTSDACNEFSDQCDLLPNSLPCDDGIFCNGTDTCAASACTGHSGDPCDGADGDGDCSEACDEAANACSANDPDLTACNDDDICTVGDVCDDGVCQSGEGENPVCVTTTTEAPTTTTLEPTTTTEAPTTTLQVTTTTVPEDVLCGDFTGDGELTAPDALGALRAAVGATTCALAVCDFNGDGQLTSTDALAILRAAVGLPSDPDCPEAT